MSTYLQLCQDAARESGTVPNIGEPTTTTGASGRLLRITKWVTEAYNDIQRQRNTWRWLYEDFSGSLISGTREYNAASLGITSRFSRWVSEGPRGRDLFTIYLPADGQDTEGFLQLKDYRDFRVTAGVGSNVSLEQKPVWITIDPKNQLQFYPTPDAAYTVRGVYYKGPQTLSSDADVPEMPEEFHQIIVWRALMLMGTYDEAFEQYPIWKTEFDRLMDQLTDNQLPRIELPGPLA